MVLSPGFREGKRREQEEEVRRGKGRGVEQRKGGDTEEIKKFL